MKLGRKRALPVLLCVLLLILVLPGCSREEGGSPEKTTVEQVSSAVDVNSQGNYETITLRVLTEEMLPHSSADIQLETLVDAFEESHKNVKVQLEFLPLNESSRAEKIEELRAQIEEGVGPDVFLLSSSGSYGDTLFPDVNKAMRSGVFFDLREFYDLDNELNLDGLNEAVMEAGVVDNAQYALPLRYDMPVLYYVPELADAMNLPTDLLCTDMKKLVDNLVWWDDPELVASAQMSLYWNGLGRIRDVVSYDTGEVLITAEEVVDLMESCRQFYELKGDTYVMAGSYFGAYLCGRHWAEVDQCFAIERLSYAIENAAVCKALGYDVEMYPLTGEDGAVVAEVTEYGAVSSTTVYPELAYQFLRQYLLEEIQWEKNTTVDAFDIGIQNGYCVRTVNSVENLLPVIWEKNCSTNHYFEGSDGAVYKLSPLEIEERDEIIRGLKLTDSDVPILQTQIDVARFPIGDFETKLGRAYNTELAENPYSPDFNRVADQFILDLQAYMQERP